MRVFERRTIFKGTVVSAGALLAMGAVPGLVGTAVAQEQSVDELLKDRILGDENAPVTMIEYSSMTCPHCAAFHRDKLPTLKEKYIDTGKMKFIIRDYPLDQLAAVASMMTRCAPPKNYFKLMDFLFERQSQWAGSQDPLGELGKIGRFAQMSQGSIDACFQNQELYAEIARRREDYGKETEIKSTPTFTINGERLVGNDSLERFFEVIESNL